VREALRNSPEYREQARAKAEEIVRRAYLAVLKREPDTGSVGYVNRVLRENWTQADVERELRRSPEFRNQ
jgi:protoheme ferro-lyase